MREKALQKEASKNIYKRMNMVVLNHRKVRFDEDEKKEWGDRLTEVDYENIKSVKTIIFNILYRLGSMRFKSWYLTEKVLTW